MPLVLEMSGTEVLRSLYAKKHILIFNKHLLIIRVLALQRLEILYKIISNWFDKPYMLFRHYMFTIL